MNAWRDFDNLCSCQQLYCLNCLHFLLFSVQTSERTLYQNRTQYCTKTIFSKLLFNIFILSVRFSTDGRYLPSFFLKICLIFIRKTLKEISFFLVEKLFMYMREIIEIKGLTFWHKQDFYALECSKN